MTREKAKVLEMLQLYQSMELLWNKKHKEYNNKERRKKAYLEILEIYKDIDPYANIKSLTKKLGNLRTSFIKELKKVKQSESAGGDLYQPTLYYYDAISFLEPACDTSNSSCLLDPLHTNSEQYLPRTSKLSTPSVSESDSDSEYRRLSPSSVQERSPSPPQKKRKILIKTSHSLKPDREHGPSTTKTLSKDEWEVLGKSIGLQLRDLDKKQLVIAQKMISDAIYLAKMGRLTEDSYVAVEKLSSPPNIPSSATKRLHGHEYSVREIKASPLSVSSVTSMPTYEINFNRSSRESPGYLPEPPSPSYE